MVALPHHPTSPSFTSPLLSATHPCPKIIQYPSIKNSICSQYSIHLWIFPGFSRFSHHFPILSQTIFPPMPSGGGCPLPGYDSDLLELLSPSPLQRRCFFLVDKLQVIHDDLYIYIIIYIYYMTRLYIVLYSYKILTRFMIMIYDSMIFD